MNIWRDLNAIGLCVPLNELAIFTTYGYKMDLFFFNLFFQACTIIHAVHQAPTRGMSYPVEDQALSCPPYALTTMTTLIRSGVILFCLTNSLILVTCILI